MYKQKLILITLLLITTFAAQAGTSDVATLKLECTINFSNYQGIDHKSISKKVTLTALKHQKGGAILVTQTDNYEFWVMTHGQQTINDLKFFNNFQVAIKDKNSSLFMHAMSDSSHDPDKKPLKSRISLVKYAKNTFLEEGELLFECLTGP